MTWQPISTAPKNGERLLLWVPKTNKGIVIGKWGSRYVTHSLEIHGWFLDGFDLPFDSDPYLPTLWQPLPDRPQ